MGKFHIHVSREVFGPHQPFIYKLLKIEEQTMALEQTLQLCSGVVMREHYLFFFVMSICF
jgi:hypothetical protein